MADEEVKNENAEAEGAEEKQEEKKGNAFSNFFKKTKANIDASMLESKIESTFNKANKEFTIYTKGKTFPTRVCGFVTDGVLTIFGEDEVEEWSVIIDDADKAFYTRETGKATVSAQVEGVVYERPGTTIRLDENVEEVCVVKAGDRYFLYKGEKVKK